MPLAHEYDLDNHVILSTGWDEITLGEALQHFEDISRIPADLSGSIAYMDLTEATQFRINETGALQLATAFEKVLDRGVAGIVVHATSDTIRDVAEIMAFTFSEVCGVMEEGYRITRTSVPAGQLHQFLAGDRHHMPMVA